VLPFDSLYSESVPINRFTSSAGSNPSLVLFQEHPVICRMRSAGIIVKILTIHFITLFVCVILFYELLINQFIFFKLPLSYRSVMERAGINNQSRGLV
jgi:hypothetical protein